MNVKYFKLFHVKHFLIKEKCDSNKRHFTNQILCCVLKKVHGRVKHTFYTCLAIKSGGLKIVVLRKEYPERNPNTVYSERLFDCVQYEINFLDISIFRREEEKMFLGV